MSRAVKKRVEALGTELRRESGFNVLCIFCRRERDSSVEHVLPLAIGGTVTIDRVCVECNSTLGSRVDAALTDFLPIRSRRARLQLAGNTGVPPNPFEILLGQSTLIGPAANRVLTTFDAATGKLDHRQLYHAADVVTPEGTKRQITIDERDKGQVPVIIQRERKRNGLTPLTDEALAIAATNYTTRTVDNLLVQKTLNVSFAYLRHAMIKIAYELAFLWLGEDYLSDALAEELSAAVMSADLASTDKVAGNIGWAADCDVFNRWWLPDEGHHLAYATPIRGMGIGVCVRIFDIYAAVVVVTRDPARYIYDANTRSRYRFLAIDSRSGKTINTAFDQETRRLRQMTSAQERMPPFSDPLNSA